MSDGQVTGKLHAKTLRLSWYSDRFSWSKDRNVLGLGMGELVTVWSLVGICHSWTVLRRTPQTEQNKSAITDHVNQENHAINWTRPRSSTMSWTRLQGGFARQSRSDRRVGVSWTETRGPTSWATSTTICCSWHPDSPTRWIRFVYRRQSITVSPPDPCANVLCLSSVRLSKVVSGRDLSNMTQRMTRIINLCLKHDGTTVLNLPHVARTKNRNLCICVR